MIDLGLPNLSDGNSVRHFRLIVRLFMKGVFSDFESVGHVG